MRKERKEHPSYGMLSFSIGTMNRNISLFGSSIQSHNIITMTLKHGATERMLNNDYYYGKGIIAKVEMSYSQFAELITSMNMEDGVPVTITYTEKDGHIEETPFESKQERFKQEFSEHLNDINQEVNEITRNVNEMFNNKSAIGKRDREKIIKMLKHLSMEIGSNSEFIYEQFNEQMDKTVTEAKGEIEAFCQNKINSIANAAIAEKQGDFKALEYSIDIAN